MVKEFLYENKRFFYLLIGIVVFSVLVYVVSSSLISFGIIEQEVYIIPVHGEISLYDSGGLFGGGASAEQIVAEIDAANDDHLISAIILDINSPGGTVVATREIAAAVEASEKPVVAWLREVAASGGYWIAASSDAIVADPATMTGSVGVIGSYLEFSDFLDEYGIKYERLTSGEFKDTGSPYKELTASERSMLQSKIDRLNSMFIQHVSERRALNEGQIRAISSAEIFLGVEAKQIGLVDVLGSKNEAIIVAQKLANLDSSRVTEFSEEISFTEQLINTFSMQSYLIGQGIGDALVKQDKDFQVLA
jgi:protease IV